MYKLPEGMSLGAYNLDKLKSIWEKVKEFDLLFSDDMMRDPVVFTRQFLNRDSVVIEVDEGFILIQNIIVGLRAEVHFCFYDHKMSARKDMLREGLKWAFEMFQLERVETFVADYARAVRRFLEERMMFKHEGTLRSRVRHQGKLIDMHIYSILRKEVM